MTDIVVDTNVPVVANGRDGSYLAECIIKCIDRLAKVRSEERVVLDLDARFWLSTGDFLTLAGSQVLVMFFINTFCVIGVTSDEPH